MRLLLMVRFNRQPLGAQHIFDEISAGHSTADSVAVAAACVQRGGGRVMIIVPMHYAAAAAVATAADILAGRAARAAAAADCYCAIIRMALASVCGVRDRRWCRHCR